MFFYEILTVRILSLFFIFNNVGALFGIPDGGFVFREDKDWAESYPSLPSPNQKTVDIVFTWVDGKDAKWREERNIWAVKEGKAPIGSDANDPARFRDNDELRYALRSVYKYAPFVRHIFIVTSGQRPAWLQDHPKITVVSHKDFFLNKSHIPTFNSHSIEANLHNIYHLADHYVYMNDDFFLGSPIKYEDFYSKDGRKVKIYLSRYQKMIPHRPTEKDNGYTAGNKNTAMLLDKAFGRKVRYTHTHTPYPQIKELVKKISKKFPEQFVGNSSHRFRSLKDYTLTNGLIPYTAYYWKRAEIGKASRMTINFGKQYKSDVEGVKLITKHEIKFFCLNDTPASKDPRSYKLVSEFLKIYFPDAAPWEVEFREKGSQKEEAEAVRKSTRKYRFAKLLHLLKSIEKNKELQECARRILKKKD